MEIRVTFDAINCDFAPNFGQTQVVHVGGVDCTYYDGSYDVTPQIYRDTVLPTADRHMSGDVTVQKIPQYEVSNDAGGTTLIIGEEYFQ